MNESGVFTMFVSLDWIGLDAGVKRCCALGNSAFHNKPSERGWEFITFKIVSSDDFGVRASA